MRVIKSHLRNEYSVNEPEMANTKNKMLIEKMYRSGKLSQGQYGELMKYDYKLYKERKEVA